jgi:hypothetical protein
MPFLFDDFVGELLQSRGHLGEHNRMPALGPKADIEVRDRDVCFGP